MTGTKTTSASNDNRRPFFPKELLAFVARSARIPYEELIGPQRRRHHVRARAVITQILIARGFSLKAIGRLIGGRDHSTISNLYHNYERHWGNDQMAQIMLDYAKHEFLDAAPPKQALPEPEPEPEKPKEVVQKRYYDFASLNVGEVRAYRAKTPIEAERVRKAAHNRNSMTDFYYRTHTKDGYVHVHRLR